MARNISGSEIYERYVEQITPLEFIAPFIKDYEESDPIQAAIDNLLTFSPCWDEVPEGFESKLYDYVQANLDRE